MRTFSKSIELAVLGLSIGTAMLADSYIGVASTRGNMSIDHANVRGNANIGAGASIQTADSTTQVQLNNGVQLTLSQQSTASVHGDHLELRQGGAQMTAGKGFGVEALGFRFVAEAGSATTQISYASANRLMVSAANGPIQVMNSEGVLLAKLSPGTTYFVEEQTDQPTARGAGQPSNNPTAKNRPQPRPRPFRSPRILVTTAVVGATATSLAVVATDSSR